MAEHDYYSDNAPKIDELLKTLSNSVRREIIRYFENHTEGTTASFEELVVHIESRMPMKTKKSLRVTLYQDHLPTLESRGWLEFDTKSTTIKYQGHDEAAQLLKKVQDVFEC